MGGLIEAAEALAFLRKNWQLYAQAYWLQLAPDPAVRRYFWSGSGQHRAFAEPDNFAKYLRGKLKECYMHRKPPIEAHGSLDLTVKPKAPVEFYRAGSPVYGRIAAADLDLREQKVKPEEALQRFAKAVNLLLDWSVEPEIRLSGGGVHFTFLLPLLEDPSVFNRKLLQWLGRKCKLIFDEKVCAEHHLMRLTFSWHPKGVFALPLDPWELEELKWQELQALAANLEEVERRLKGYGERWQPVGSVVELERFRALLKLLEPEGSEKGFSKQRLRKVWKKLEGWVRCEVPGLGKVEYSVELEGFGYVRVLAEKEVILKDGKLNVTWLLLAPAVARGLLSREEAENLLRKSAAVCGRDPEPYLKKLEYELRRRVGKDSGSAELALPTWRSLLTGRKKSGEPLEDYYGAVREPLLRALSERGLVRFSGRTSCTTRQASSRPPA